MAKKFWVRINGREQGPFSSAQLKRFAEQGKLKQEHEVSVDQLKWVPASAVKGLPLEAPPPPQDELFAESWDPPAETGNDPFGSDPLGNVPLGTSTPPADDLWGDLPPAGMAAQPGFAAPAAGLASMPAAMGPAGFPSAPSFSGPMPSAPGATESMAVRWPTGVTIGVVIGFVMLISGCVLTAAAAAVLEDSPAVGGFVVVVGLGGLFLALAVFICSGVGSKTTVALSASGAGQTNCTVTRRLAFLPIHSEEFLVTSNDTLHKNIRDCQTASISPGMADIIMIVFVLGMCAVGFFPGLVFWVFWWRARNNEQHSYTDLTLTLNAYSRGSRLRLWKKRVQDYRGTRFGDPPELDKLIKMFARFNGPRLVIEEM